MVDINKQGSYWRDGHWQNTQSSGADSLVQHQQAREKTMAYGILRSHSEQKPGDDAMHIRFDALTSHDITYVGIVQTARASGLERFPVPYVLTNCHNSLCAVGGTINEDDHLFGLSAAKKYGGIYVPAHLAVLHQYMREMHASCGGMILGSDSHTRYGALGCMGVGEGGPELVKQVLERTYDIAAPEVVAVYLEGAPKPGVGPQDVALALIKSVFKDGTVKNKVLEFMGPGVASLSVDYRLGIDVMTTESTCLSSIWQTDEHVRDWLTALGRPEGYKELRPQDGAWYDAVIRIDLGAVEPMIAIPFHPSNAWTIKEFLANAEDILNGVEAEAEKITGSSSVRGSLRKKFRDGAFMTDQAVIAGCSGGTYENLVQVAAILNGKSTQNGAFNLSLYPSSQPVYMELTRTGHALELMQTGAVLKTAFCGPCFGAGDVPANNAFSIRHTTRNFPNREGSKPGEGQLSFVALMDARSIAATAANGGKLMPATELPEPPVDTPEGVQPPYVFDKSIYEKRVYQGFDKADAAQSLVFGPNIADWPAIPALPENLLLVVASAIYDPVTTTDELIPSGETSSYRSNPLRLAEYTLSRKDPAYVGRAKAVLSMELLRRKETGHPLPGDDKRITDLCGCGETTTEALFASMGIAGQEGHTGIGSLVFARKPGDGSAREQAASCQKVLGTWANIAEEYATKRYRSNLVNWGMLPFVLEEGFAPEFKPGDMLYLPGIRQVLISGSTKAPAILRSGDDHKNITLLLPDMTKEERDIILAGCLMNHYAEQ